MKRPIIRAVPLRRAPVVAPWPLERLEAGHARPNHPVRLSRTDLDYPA